MLNIKKFFYIITTVIMLLSILVTVIYAAYVTYKPTNIVLMYHSIQPEPLNKYVDLYVSPDDFEDQLKIIKDSGLTAEFISNTTSGDIYITFDDGYEDNYIFAFPLIQQYEIKITIFIITDFIGEKGYLNEEQIKEMVDSGLVSFQCHTATHQDLTTLTDDDLNYELIESKEKLESITGKAVDVISYPYGKYNDKVLALASQVYKTGVTTKGPNIFTDTDNNLTIPRYGISRKYDMSAYSSLIQYL